MPAERDSGISIADHISHQLRDDIMEGKLPSGTQLVEVDLAANYGASRNTIREVLHQLGREGLATFIRHKGVVVRRMEGKDLREIYAARRALELQAITGEQPLQAALLDRMRTAIDAAERALVKKQWRKVGTLSLQVHQHIVAQLGSRLLDAFFLTLCAQLRLVFTAGLDERWIQTPDWIERERRIHRLLVAGRRSLAAQTMATYLDDSERTLMAVLTRLKQQKK